jgi:hypothetical protein
MVALIDLGDHTYYGLKEPQPLKLFHCLQYSERMWNLIKVESQLVRESAAKIRLEAIGPTSGIQCAGGGVTYQQRDCPGASDSSISSPV